MSLINDALKRAKETQPAAAPAAGPDLRPVDSSPRPNKVGFLLPLLVVVILALAGGCNLGLAAQRRRSKRACPQPDG